MRNKLIRVMCLAYMTAAASGQLPLKPGPAVVRQVDHIVIGTRHYCGRQDPLVAPH